MVAKAIKIKYFILVTRRCLEQERGRITARNVNRLAPRLVVDRRYASVRLTVSGRPLYIVLRYKRRTAS